METARNLDFKGFDWNWNHRKGAALQWKVASRQWPVKRGKADETPDFKGIETTEKELHSSGKWQVASGQ